MELAGASTKIFNENAIDAIFNISTGIIRVINNLSTKSLIKGSSDRTDIITEEQVYSASIEL